MKLRFIKDKFAQRNKMTGSELFLTDDQLIRLTGRHHKSLQIAWLRKNGIAHYVSASGHPRVAKSVIDGRASNDAQSTGWQPKVLRAA